MHANRRVRSRGAGWEYVHGAIDDATRVAFVEVLAAQDGDTTADFLARAVAWFARQGVPIRRVMSDNGSGYVSRAFRRACHAFALRHLLTRPYTPRTNGKAEASFRRSCGNGRFPGRTGRRCVGPRPWPAGSRITTANVPTRVLITELPGHDFVSLSEQRV